MGTVIAPFWSVFKTLPFLAVSLALMLALALRTGSRFLSQNVRVTFFDVGQGDGALVQLPGGETLMIDAGGGKGDWNVGKWVLFPELARRGILRIDAALLTHPDADHGMGFLSLFQDLAVGRFIYGSSFAETPNSLLQDLWRRLPSSSQTHVGERLDFVRAGVRFSVFSAQFPVTEKNNNRSLLVWFEYAGCSVLFTGDIEASAESALVPQMSHATFLKVAHHGSKTSSTQAFLKKVRPRYGIISSGRGNSYGHPHTIATNRLRAEGIEILRTDFHGAIEVELFPNGHARCMSAVGFCGWIACQSSSFRSSFLPNSSRALLLSSSSRGSARSLGSNLSR